MNVLFKKLVEETDLAEDDIKAKVEEKVQEFSGLVSEEGALHLVANDLGVEFEKVPTKLPVENIVADMPNLDLTVKVVRILDPRTFDRKDGTEGTVQNIVLGDETGTIRLALWDEQTKISERLDEGDVLNLNNVHSVEGWQDRPELRISQRSTIEMSEEDIGDVKQSQSYGGRNYQDVHIINAVEERANYALRGTVLAIYAQNPFYTVCEKCGGSTSTEDDTVTCEKCGEVDGKNALAISAILDDGTGNMRCVFFRDRARDFLNIEEDTALTQDQVENAAGRVVGSELVVKGFTKHNDYFGRLEFIVSETSTANTKKLLTQKVDALN